MRGLHPRETTRGLPGFGSELLALEQCIESVSIRIREFDDGAGWPQPGHMKANKIQRYLSRLFT